MPTNIIIIGANSLGLSVARECIQYGVTVTVLDSKQTITKEIWECRKLGCNIYINTIITDIRPTENGTVVYATSANHKSRRYIANQVLQAPETNDSSLHSFILNTSHAVFPSNRWRTVRTITAENKKEVLNYSAFKDKACKK